MEEIILGAAVLWMAARGSKAQKARKFPKDETGTPANDYKEFWIHENLTDSEQWELRWKQHNEAAYRRINADIEYLVFNAEFVKIEDLQTKYLTGIWNFYLDDHFEWYVAKWAPDNGKWIVHYQDAYIPREIRPGIYADFRQVGLIHETTLYQTLNDYKKALKGRGSGSGNGTRNGGRGGEMGQRETGGDGRTNTFSR